MPVEDFLVRNKRRLVENYSHPGAWEQLNVAAQGELTREVAGLTSVHADTDVDARQFDVLMLNLQLAGLRVDARFDELKESVIELAGAMEEKQAIPMVCELLPLIREVQRAQFWQGVTVPELENVRLNVRVGPTCTADSSHLDSALRAGCDLGCEQPPQELNSTSPPSREDIVYCRSRKIVAAGACGAAHCLHSAV